MRLSDLESNLDEGFMKNAAMAAALAGSIGAGAAHAGGAPIGINGPGTQFSQQSGGYMPGVLPKADIAPSGISDSAEKKIKTEILPWWISLDSSQSAKIRTQFDLPRSWIIKQKEKGSRMSDDQLADSWWFEAKALVSK